ncbi:MAG: hypothetical protein NTZ60_02655 [Campylobacterales bacterium]|nr:hypothetical protein [Campylobacterales bacterium]
MNSFYADILKSINSELAYQVNRNDYDANFVNSLRVTRDFIISQIQK